MTDTPLDYYQILGVAVNAKPETIRKAYKKLCQKFHPDKSSEPGDAEHFTRIRRAYDMLFDPQRRAIYDQGLRQGISPQEFQMVLKAMIQKIILATLAVLDKDTNWNFLTVAKQAMRAEKVTLKDQIAVFKKQQKKLTKYTESIKKGQEAYLAQELSKKAVEINVGIQTLEVAQATLEFLRQNTEQIVCPEERTVQDRMDTLLGGTTQTFTGQAPRWRP